MKNLERSTSAVVLAAGSSTRMGQGVNKILLDLGGRTVLEHSIAVFASLDEVAEIVLVLSTKDLDRLEDDFRNRLDALGVRKIIAGGALRFESAAEGIAACGPGYRLVLIHDGARPFPPADAVQEAIRTAASNGGAILAIPLQDTLKQVNEEGRIVSTLPRKDLFRAQTPQVFQQALLRSALAAARTKGLEPTDDALLLEETGHPVSLVQGDPLNIKITTQEDLILARALLQARKDGGERK